LKVEGEGTDYKEGNDKYEKMVEEKQKTKAIERKMRITGEK
jgi:hypothetical protein